MDRLRHPEPAGIHQHQSRLQQPRRPQRHRREDIRDMADSFQKRTIANRINFGMRRTKWLIAMMHWVQDFYRCSKQPTIDDFITATNFKQALSTAAQCASLRKVDTDQVDTISKAADPGKLKDERK